MRKRHHFDASAGSFKVRAQQRTALQSLSLCLLYLPDNLRDSTVYFYLNGHTQPVKRQCYSHSLFVDPGSGPYSAHLLENKTKIPALIRGSDLTGNRRFEHPRSPHSDH